MANANQGPGRRRCLRAGGWIQKNAAKPAMRKGEKYLLRNVPISPTPTTAHHPVQSFSRAFQPATMARVQKATVRASTVRMMDPTDNNGMEVSTATRKKPVRHPANRATNPDNPHAVAADSTGAKNRTPNSRSPHKWVPIHCA